MNNQNSQILARIEAIKAEKPWLETYEIESMIAEETGVDISEYYEASLKQEPEKTEPLGKYGAYETEEAEPEKKEEAPAPAAPAPQTLTDEEKKLQQDRENAKKAVEKHAKKQITKAISKEMTKIGITLLIYVILSLGLCVGLSVFLVLVSGKDIVEASAFVSDSRFSAIFEGCIMLIALALPFVMYVYFNKLSIGDLVPLRKLRKGELLPMTFIGLGTVMVTGYITNTLTSGLSLTGANYRYNSVSLGTTMGEFLISLACLTIVPAVVETYVFNGVILQVLRRKGGDGFALVMSALLHAIMTANFAQMPQTFVTSIVLGYLVVYSGSLIPAALVRGIELFLFLGITQLGFVVPDLNSVLFIDILITAILIVASIFSINTMLKRFPNFFQIKRSDRYLSVSEKVRIALLRPSVLILIVYSVGFSLLQLISLNDIMDLAEKIGL